MGRRELKLSFNPTYQNSIAIDFARQRSKLTLTEVLNNYIGYTACLSDEVKSDLLSFIDKEIQARELLKKNCEGALHFNELESQITQLNGLKLIITNYNSNDEDSKEHTLAQIPLRNGYLQYPRKWLLVNPESAKEFDCAYVLECYNGSRWGINHYVYFDNLREMSKEFQNQIVTEVLRVYPEFQRVLDMQVQLIYKEGEPKTVGNALNLEEWAESPVIGVFRIQNSFEIRARQSTEPNYLPPSLAEVVR